MTTAIIPKKQRAVQLVGPDQLQLNESKDVLEPGPHQILGRVEVVGLCFSDLKLLKQFSGHARKSPVTMGIDLGALEEMSNYVPGDKPTVPGHETVIRIVKVGDRVQRHQVGGRFLVQTDYRWLPTSNSNSAFGYNFEGALQEYVLLDERVITSPDGESMLIPVPEDLSASAIALVEPWACVEDSYVEKQRKTLKDGGQLLVVGETTVDPSRIQNLPARPGKTTFTTADKIGDLKNGAYDDVIHFGSNPASVEQLFA
jgi:threonine dehydrogenase-like Zn-dependent dehydrogenase